MYSMYCKLTVKTAHFTGLTERWAPEHTCFVGVIPCIASKFLFSSWPLSIFDRFLLFAINMTYELDQIIALLAECATSNETKRAFAKKKGIPESTQQFPLGK